MNGLAMRTATGRLYRAGKHRASVVIGPLGTEVDTYADAINASGGSDPRVDLMPSIAIGVGQGWGNAANLADMDQLYANITQMPLFRAKASPLVSKVHLGSLSMGGCVVYNWAIRHPEKVASIFTLVPPCSIQDIWDNNRLNLKSSIDTAFAGRPPDAYSLDKCDGSVLVGIPHRLYYSIADPIALPAFSIAWGEECGAEIFAMGGPGHSLDPTVYSMLDEAWWRHALD